MPEPKKAEIEHESGKDAKKRDKKEKKKKKEKEANEPEKKERVAFEDLPRKI